MARKRYKPEEIVAKLRQVDVLVSQGQNMVDAIRQIGVSEVTYYRWRQEFGGLKSEQVKRLKDLELENSRLRKAVSDLTLDKLILQEAARGNFAPRVAMPALSRSERSCVSPSVAPVRRSGSIARRNARSRAVVTTSSISRPILSSLPGNTAAMAIARSPHCCARRAGQSTTSGSSVSGDARG
jgi:putative transposase